MIIDAKQSDIKSSNMLLVVNNSNMTSISKTNKKKTMANNEMRHKIY